MSTGKLSENEIFGQRLRKLMDAAKMTQVELADHLGVSQSAVHSYLAGRIPKADRFIEIAKVFGVSMDDLLNRPPGEISPSQAGLFAAEAGMFLADLRSDLQDAESALADAKGRLKQAGDKLGLAKIIVTRLQTIHQTNAKRKA